MNRRRDFLFVLLVLFNPCFGILGSHNPMQIPGQPRIAGNLTWPLHASPVAIFPQGGKGELAGRIHSVIFPLFPGDHSPSTIPTTADAPIKIMGWSFFVCLTLLVNTHSTAASTIPFQLKNAMENPSARVSAKNRLETITYNPAAAISPVDAGRRP